MPADKRRATRVPTELWIEAERQGELYYQRASNLSSGGVFFSQTVPLPVGTRVTLSFELPDGGEVVRCEGDIVSAKDLGMGVQFVGLTKEHQVRVDAYVSAAAAQEPLKR